MTSTTGAQLQAVRQGVLNTLIAEFRNPHRPLPKDVLEDAAAKCKVSTKTIRRWIDEPTSPRSGPFQLDDTQLDIITAYGGNLRRAHEHAASKGLHGDVSYRTWTEAWKRVPAWLRLGITEGPQAAKAAQFYAQRTTGHVGEVLEMDGWEPNIRVQTTGPRGYSAAGKASWCKPYVLGIIDQTSRYLLGAAVFYPPAPSRTGKPDAEFVAAAIVQTLRHREIRPESVGAEFDCAGLPDDAFIIGGRPVGLLTDNDSTLSGTVVNSLAVAAGFELETAAAYTGEGKPHIERWFLTEEIGDLFLLEGQSHGPKDYQGGEPFKGRCATKTEFEQMLAATVDEYNHRRIHSSLGMTPYEAWVRRSVRLPEIDENVVRAFRMRHPYRNGRRIVEKRGVRIDDLYYPLDEHARRVCTPGDEVEIRCEPNDPSWVDVWERGSDGHGVYIGRAWHPSKVDVRDRAVLPRERTHQRRRMRSITKDAVERRRDIVHERLAAVRANGSPGPADFSDLIAAVDELKDDATFLAQLHGLFADETEDSPTGPAVPGTPAPELADQPSATGTDAAASEALPPEAASEPPGSAEPSGADDRSSRRARPPVASSHPNGRHTAVLDTNPRMDRQARIDAKRRAARIPGKELR